MTVHVDERGSGPVLLCLHGIGSSGRAFAPQLAGLGDRYRVVAWDAPGYDRSPDPEGAPGLAGYARAVADLVETLGAPVHLLGVSWGGVIASRVALDHPRLLRSLILVDSSRGSGRDPRAAAAMRARAVELAERGPDAFAIARAPRLLSPAADPALVERVRRTMAEAIRLPGYDYAAQSMADTDLGPRLAEIAAPTLVLCGEQDVVTGPLESRALADGIPGAAHVPIRYAGHLAHQERPEAVNAWVDGFLQIVERLNP